MATNGLMGNYGEGSGGGQDVGSSGSGGNQGKRQKLKELVRPIFQESYFTAEYCLLGAVQVNQPGKLSGLYAIPSAQSPFLWFAALFVHNGPWQGAVFRFTLKFPDNFPDASQQNNLPAVQFWGAYPKHHPLISPSRGIFDLKRYYKTYSRSSNHIWQLLKCTRKIFYKLEILEKVSYPNKSAAELYLKSPQDQFLRKCETDVQASISKVFEDDPYSNDANYIRFTKDFKNVATAESSSDSGNSSSRSSGIGLSWMVPTSS